MSKQTEELVKLHYPVIAPLLMGAGVGDGKTTMCVMAQAACIDALRKGKTLETPTDNMACACPVLRRTAIRLNDTNWWKDNAERTEILRPIIPLLFDSRGDQALTARRMFFVADHAVRVITPMRVEWIVENRPKQQDRLQPWLDAIRKIQPITDKASALVARDLCREMRDAAVAYADAAAAAVAADAAAAVYAAAAADAADAAAVYAAAAAAAVVAADAAAAVYAAAAAAAAVYAAYAAYAADADENKIFQQKLKYRTSLLECFYACAALK